MSTLELPRPGEGLGRDAANTLGSRPWSLTVEHLAYGGLGLLSLIAHFLILGERALHHDETLHAAYSWYLVTGRGYIHDPLLHGPLLYYIGAFFYFLFGDNDFTARVGAALAGSALTLTPFLLRRDIGRPAALAAAVYLLISPVALYVGRFIRHDIYSVLLEVLVVAAIVRYSATRAARWLYLGVGAFGLMLVNQETAYLFALIIFAPLLLIFLWRTWRPGVAVLAALGVAALLFAFVLPAEARVDGGNNALRDANGAMEIEKPSPLGWAPLATDDNAYALRIRNRADDDGGRSLLVNAGLYLQDLGEFFGHPAVLLGLALAAAAAAGLYWAIWRRADAEGRTAWGRAIDRGDPAALVAASLAADGRWRIALAIFLGIYALFFTAFFTNLLGLITGTTGSLLYWLAQHNVERGGQPGHYYLFQLAVYEPLLLIFGTVGLLLLGRALFVSRRAAADAWPDAQGSLFSIGLIAWWAIAAFAIYTWAGEKMPWLTIHLSVPLTLFSAWAFQQLAFPAPRPEPAPPGQQLDALNEQLAPLDMQLAPLVPLAAPADTRPSVAGLAFFAGLFAAVVGLSFVLMTAVVAFGDRAVLPLWVVPLGGLTLITMIVAAAGLRWGSRQAIALLAICGVVALGLYTARSAYRLAYINGDTPREPMVYTQTSPDVMRVIRRLEEASRRRGGDLDMPIIYDNETVWTWYMRDFPNATRGGEQLAGPPGPEVMAVLMLQENLDRFPENRNLLDGFVIQRYPLRWWLPEDQVYRLPEGWREAPVETSSLLAQALRAPFDRDANTRLWKFLMFRDPGAPLGSSDFIVAVRPEIAAQIGPGLGGTLSGEIQP
jgi:predicted membrane-bound mannosyltransferase